MSETKAAKSQSGNLHHIVIPIIQESLKPEVGLLYVFRCFEPTFVPPLSIMIH